MALALFFSFKPYLNGIKPIIDNPFVLLESYNYVLIFMGLGVSFATLQDTTKTQNDFSKKIWQNPKKGKMMITLICFLVFIFLAYGLFGYFITDNQKVREVSFGSIVFGIGLIGFLKTALEVFENHRLE
ncbi:MAG: magnesium-transporting ATPase (P-type) [Flammeovirgaceae bacterium]|jgi:magnesium-transporting ATPase (P-type)